MLHNGKNAPPLWTFVDDTFRQDDDGQNFHKVFGQVKAADKAVVNKYRSDAKKHTTFLNGLEIHICFLFFFSMSKIGKQFSTTFDRILKVLVFCLLSQTVLFGMVRSTYK